MWGRAARQHSANIQAKCPGDDRMSGFVNTGRRWRQGHDCGFDNASLSPCIALSELFDPGGLFIEEVFPAFDLVLKVAGEVVRRPPHSHIRGAVGGGAGAPGGPERG